jgi:2-dehydropantoate 2-reductase
MDDFRIAVVGVGATGAVLAAALLSRNADTVLVDPRPGLGEHLQKNGVKVSGELSYQVPVRHFVDRIEKLKKLDPNLVFLCTKTFHLAGVIEDLKSVVRPGAKIVSAHNGLGPEDVVAEAFGADAAFRMSLNYGVSLQGPGEVAMAFFNRPNHLGALTKENRKIGSRVAELLTEGGLETECVDDIKLSVWKKMVMKCTMASICAVTDRTLKEILDFPPTREIADNCFKEALAVAKAQGYDLGENYLPNALAYLEKAGAHKDSMCYDIAQKAPTEIDFLGGKIVEYARRLGISTPFYAAMTNMVKAIEDSYLRK